MNQGSVTTSSDELRQVGGDIAVGHLIATPLTFVPQTHHGEHLAHIPDCPVFHPFPVHTRGFVGQVQFIPA